MSLLKFSNVFSNSRRKLLLSSAVLGLVSGLQVLPAWSAEAKILNTRSYVDISTLDPANYVAASEEDVMGAIYSKLIYFKPGNKWEWELQAAESIEQLDDTHIAFTLRSGIMFTNGFGEMTAEDVKFSFERSAAESSSSSGDWGAFSHVEVTGKYSGVIVLNKPFQPIWNVALSYAAGNIVSKKAVESVGGKFTTTPPAVSGPYMLKDWKPKQEVVLVRNPDYYGDQAEFDEIHIRQIDDEKTAEIAYEAGDLDITRISMSSIENYQQSPPENSTLSVYPSLYYTWVGMNVTNPKLEDPKVRKAIQLAIDLPSIMAVSYFNAAEPSTGIIAPGLTGHREKGLIPDKADFVQAKKLLEAAGATGLELNLDVLNKSTNISTAQVIQATLSQIGVKINVNLHEAGSFWSLGSESAGDRWKSIELVLNRYSSVPDPYYSAQWFTSEQRGKWNWERFSNAEYDELNAKAMAESDSQKRSQMYQRMQDLMEDSGAYRFLTHEAEPLVYRNSIVPGLRPDGRPLYRHFKSN